MLSDSKRPKRLEKANFNRTTGISASRVSRHRGCCIDVCCLEVPSFFFCCVGFLVFFGEREGGPNTFSAFVASCCQMAKEKRGQWSQWNLYLAAFMLSACKSSQARGRRWLHTERNDEMRAAVMMGGTTTDDLLLSAY